MANYKIAIDPILQTEGGWVNNPNDNGGETYRGISRKFWPSWGGWRLIDQHRLNPDFPKTLARDAYLQDLVVGFYKTNFWDKIGGDGINDQSIADLLVDSAVNEGISPAVKRAQGIVGLPQTGHITDELVEKLNLMP